jgi:hypothetical protein
MRIASVPARVERRALSHSERSEESGRDGASGQIPRSVAVDPTLDEANRALPSTDASDTAAAGLHCQKCGYDLRGLPGDPIRCPECFHENARNDLVGPAAKARRLRELQGAGDGFVLAMICFAGGLALWGFNGLLPLAAPLLAVGGLLTHYSTATARRLGRGRESWMAAWSRYLILTCALPLVPSAIWLVFAIMVWTTRSFYQQTNGLDFIDFGVALPVTIVTMFLKTPLRRLRSLQRRAFARLMRLTVGR